jgi:hypothetical protein
MAVYVHPVQLNVQHVPALQHAQYVQMLPEIQTTIVHVFEDSMMQELPNVLLVVQAVTVVIIHKLVFNAIQDYAESFLIMFVSVLMDIMK